MDPVLLTFLACAGSGVVYYVLYRHVLVAKLKWKMIHSIWLPIAVALFGIVYAIVYNSQPHPGVYMPGLAVVGILVVFLTPVLIFFILYAIGAYRDRHLPQNPLK